jgi:hypothetical protein
MGADTVKRPKETMLVGRKKGARKDGGREREV